jgi:hypothetical protein
MAKENGDNQRWEYALKLSESNNEQISKLTENLEAQRKRIDALAETSERHEREQQRFRAVMMAAFQAYLTGGNGPTELNE